jgi:TP901 family phage tail tape measure protein
MQNQLAQFVIGYLGFQALLSGTQKLIHQNYELSDSISQIKIYTKESTGEVDNLVDSLKKLDTRTSLHGLVDIAQIVAKKGVVKEEITGVTQALDQLFVVLGKEVGDPHEAVASMVKLVNVYSEDKHVTAKNIGDIGAAIAKLTSSGVATGRFLIDFSERMAGIRGITGITIDKVLGLGAALQELGQRTEVSATALSQMLVKLFVNTDKYAAIVGKTKKEFTEMLRNSPLDAFVLVAEKLKGNAGEMEKFFEGITDLHVRGQKVAGVLGDIAGNAEYAKKRMNDATRALGDQASLTAAFTEKNNNFASTLDKISKKFEILGANKSVQVTLTAIASVLALLLGNIPTLLVLTGLWITGWAILNKELFLARANMLLLNLQTIAYRIALGATIILTNAYTVTMGLLTGSYGLATAAAMLFNKAITRTPIGVILTLLGILGATFAAFAGTVTNATATVVAHADRLRFMAELQNKVQDQTLGTINKITLLTSVLKDNTISLTSRQQALKDLIAVAPEYLDRLTLENIKTAEGKHILDAYIVSMQKKAELQAGEAITNKAIEERTRLEKTLFDLELKRKQGKTGREVLSDEEQEFLPAFRGKYVPFGAAIASTFGGGTTIDAVINEVKSQIKAKNVEIELANSFIKDKYKQLGETVKGGDQKVENTTPLRTPTYLKGLIDEINKELDQTEIGTALAKELLTKREKLQAELDAATKSPKSSQGSHLTGTQRDNLRDEDADRNTALAEQKLSFAKGQQTEEEYLKNSLKINQDAISKKLSLIKGNNAAERKLRSDLELELATDEKETNEKLFKIEEDRIKDSFENAKKEAELTAKTVLDSVTATETEKAQAKLDADKAILAAQDTFNTSMDVLEDKFSGNSKKTSKDRATAIMQINTDLNKDRLALSKATLADLQIASDTQVAIFKAQIAEQRAAISKDKSYSSSKKTVLFDKLDKTETVGILAIEVKSMQDQLPKYKELLDNKKIAEKEYYDFLEKLKQKIVQLQKSTDDSSLTSVVSFSDNLKGIIKKNFKTSDDMTKVIAEGVAGAYNLAQEAMSGYYDAERARVQQNRDAIQEKLDLEKEQLLKFAQGKADEERIDKLYAKKKKEADKQAGKELKEIKRKEIRLEFITELSSIAAAAAANPLNKVTLGAAGIAQYATQAALALGKYAIRISDLNNTQFAWGGSPDVPTRGGKFGGKPHSQGGTPFIYKGNTFEAEADELAIIRTKNAPTGNYTISGNHTQIASALNQLGGGIGFASGASISKFEYGGGLGQSLQAPVYVPSSSPAAYRSDNSDYEKRLSLLEDQTKAIQATNDRIDRIEVVQVTSTVTSAQKKAVKQTNIGTL